MDIRTGYFHADDPFRDPSRVGMPPAVDERLTSAQIAAESLADQLAPDRITYSGMRLIETTLQPFQVYRFSVLRGLITEDSRRAARRSNTIWNGRRAKRFTQASLFAQADADLMESLAAESDNSADAVSHLNELMIAQPHLQPYIDGQRIMFDPAVGSPNSRKRSANRDAEMSPEIEAPEFRPVRQKRRRGAKRAAGPPPSHFAPDSVSIAAPRGNGRGTTHAEPVVDVDFVVRQPLGVARPVPMQRARPATAAKTPGTGIVPAAPAKKKPSAAAGRRPPTTPPSQFKPLGSTVRPSGA